jgi:phospholipid/cholesterol/gamma-HCH transport system permease protein
MTAPLAGRGWTVKIDGTRLTISLTGDWIARLESGAEPGAAEQILAAVGTESPGISVVEFDASALGRWDSALLVFVIALRQVLPGTGPALDESGLPSAACRLLALTADAVPATEPPVDRTNLFARVGKALIAAWVGWQDVVTLVGDTVLRCGAALRGKARMQGGDLLACTYDAGIGALPIVTIVNILVGGILAFVGAVQLRKFGADIYIANLVGLAMVREMAAIMTAIVMSGRTGGAYAAHIATMQGNEEIDALRAIGVPIYDYLILPRVVALTCMMPLLYLYGSAVGIFDGFVVAVSMLNISPEAFIEQTRASVGGSQILFGLAKSITFGTLIAIAGCRSGLNAGRSAADVGRAATTAVVIGIVGVIALDAVFAVCANTLDF